MTGKCGQIRDFSSKPPPPFNADNKQKSSETEAQSLSDSIDFFTWHQNQREMTSLPRKKKIWELENKELNLENAFYLFTSDASYNMQMSRITSKNNNQELLRTTR